MKMNKKLRRILLTVCSAALLVCVTVGATVAYLTSEKTVTNTFTVGKVAITLDEADVKPDGTYETNQDARVTANEYHLVPGHTYIKDPVVHVAADSEDCWLFVKLENDLKDIIDTTTIENQITAKGWTVLDADNGIYAYNTKVTKSSTIQNFPVFDNFKLKNDADVSDYVTDKTADDPVEIKVTAYAVQADGFTSAQAAWTATYGAPQTGADGE